MAGILKAYNTHHHLILRPDDIWIAVLTQFSLYMNANAEKLRSHFVKHEGKKELVVHELAVLRTAHYDYLSQQLTEEIAKHLIDKTVKEWIIPDFTTSTKNDKVVASVVMMSAMQKYFSYTMCLSCGIPRVTLEGELSDWVNLRERIQRLDNYDIGDGTINKWSKMLEAISTEFINSFLGPANLEFWDRVCSHRSTGSGPSYLSGWITAFCAFNEHGKWQATKSVVKTWNGHTIENGGWPVIDTKNVPPGVVSVPVTIDDNGVEYKCCMFAGHMSYTVDGGVVRPRVDWAMALVDANAVQKARKQMW